MSVNKSKPEQPIQCRICNVTVQRRCLSQHWQTHREGFICDICGVFKTKRKDVLQVHKKQVHGVGAESINVCLFCEKKLPSFAALEAHLRPHTMERPFICKFCPCECTTANNLKIHTRTIHGLKRRPTFRCHICSKMLLEKKYLKTHLKIHLVPVEDLPFKCDVCSKAFRNTTRLNLHKSVHSKEKPFPCEICNAAFSLMDYLNVHLRVHTGEKPYSCTVCKRRFSQRSSLKSHMRTHSGKKPFSCKKCKVAYSHKQSLYAHLKLCHA